MKHLERNNIEQEVSAGTSWSETDTDTSLSQDDLDKIVELEWQLRRSWDLAWERNDIRVDALIAHPSFAHLRRVHADDLLRSKQHSAADELLIHKWVEGYSYLALIALAGTEMDDDIFNGSE
ncbi:hypothetical protein SAMN04488523_1219 [Sulfitobacter brevis]|uniref:Uncharacterized protein n=1 Tax=Sulfitobacter brevis TaxID=74348 RepID=A0A1I2GA79_9RHOB|nr:hypothetical protein [Sulfitobacter brevis]SFF14412.1 hypothetical protein SAMN04488523_1219 [Sulfitobacter brevis]